MEKATQNLENRVVSVNFRSGTIRKITYDFYTVSMSVTCLISDMWRDTGRKGRLYVKSYLYLTPWIFT